MKVNFKKTASGRLKFDVAGKVVVAGEVERESGVERECVGLCVRGDGERKESFVVF